MNNVTIAVFGSSGAGKTFISAALAAGLAKQGAESVVVFPNAISPVIPALFSYKQEKEFSTKDVKSLGKLTSITSLSQNDVFNQFITIPGYKRLCALGYAASENQTYYPTVYSSDAAKIRLKLKECCNYVIYDCNTDFRNDAFSADALTNADIIIRVSQCKNQDLSFFMSQLPQCKNFKVPTDQHLVVLNGVRKEDPNNEIKDFHGRTDCTIPFDERIYETMDEGKFLREPISRAVEKSLSKLVALILEKTEEV